MSERAYIALGSNVGDRLSYLRRALKALKEHPEIHLSALSSVYETKPVGLTEQADFLNMVAAVDTALSPHALLDVTQGIEQALHRRREIRWGPRTLDIDILLYGNVTMEEDRLTIPHPRMTERAFVLVPLAELGPDVDIPGTGRTVQQQVEHVKGKEGIQRCPTISLAAEFGLTAS